MPLSIRSSGFLSRLSATGRPDFSAYALIMALRVDPEGQIHSNSGLLSSLRAASALPRPASDCAWTFGLGLGRRGLHVAGLWSGYLLVPCTLHRIGRQMSGIAARRHSHAGLQQRARVMQSISAAFLHTLHWARAPHHAAICQRRLELWCYAHDHWCDLQDAVDTLHCLYELTVCTHHLIISSAAKDLSPKDWLFITSARQNSKTHREVLPHS